MQVGRREESSGEGNKVIAGEMGVTGVLTM